jgi:small conductance mechanosensitive channel
MVINVNMKEATAKAVEQISNWVDTFFKMLPSIVVAIILIILFVLLSFLVRRLVDKGTWKLSGHRHIGRVLGRMSMILTIAGGLILALDILNLDRAVASLLAGIGILGLAIGFAAKDIFANFVSGMVMHFVHPFRIGDLVITSDGKVPLRGYVEALQMRSTIIRTTQGQRVTVPNSAVMGNAIVNFTVTGVRRIDLKMGISYGDDLDKAEALAVEAVEGLESRKTERPVEFFYEEVGASSINFLIRFWTAPEQPAYLKARSDAIKAIKRTFEEHGITIPFQIVTLDFEPSGGVSLVEHLKDMELPLLLQKPTKEGED